MTKIRLRAHDEVLARQLEDPEFREEWERTAPARAVANQIVAYRARHGLTQKQLAALLDMPQSAVARLESGEHVPKIETLSRISDALGITFHVDIAPGTPAVVEATPTN